MIRKIFLIIIVLCNNRSFSQVSDTIADSLLQLKKADRALEKYVNFDVIKIMMGSGRSLDHYSGFGMGISFKGQLLWPYSISKNHFPIAIGFTIGFNKITRPNSEYIFADNKLTNIVHNDKVIKTVQKSGYVGILALKVIRLQAYTILTGVSFEYNRLGNKLKIESDREGSILRNKDYITPVSIPIHFQVSRSRRQFISWGFFMSYDTQPRFRTSAFKNVKQLVAGLSVGVII